MTNATIRHESPAEIHQLLTRWQREGLLDADEVARIEAAEAARADTAVDTAGRARATSGALLAEALGYVGGALILAAVGVLIGRNWDHLLLGGRLGITLPASVLLLAVGLALPDRLGTAGPRLRAVLWTASTALAFAGWVLIGGDGFGWHARAVLLLAAPLAAAQAGLLWWRSHAVLLHLATFASLAVFVGAASDHMEFLHEQAVGVGLWMFAAAWVLLAVLDVVRPPLVACLAGAMLALFAAQTTTTVRWGGVFALVTAAIVIAFAVWRRSLPVLAVGTYGVLSSVPAAAERLFPGSTGVALGLLVAGVVLVVSALWITRHGAARGR